MRTVITADPNQTIDYNLSNPDSDALAAQAGALDARELIIEHTGFVGPAQVWPILRDSSQPPEPQFKDWLQRSRSAAGDGSHSCRKLDRAPPVGFADPHPLPAPTMCSGRVGSA